MLIPLDPETMRPDASVLAGYKDGSTFLMGTLYMGGIPLLNPTMPDPSGTIPDYIPGSELHIGDSDPDPRNQISWIKAGHALFADRNLLKNVSLEDLEKQGLVFAKEAALKQPLTLDDLIREALEESQRQAEQSLTPELIDVLYQNIRNTLTKHEAER